MIYILLDFHVRKYTSFIKHNIICFVTIAVTNDDKILGFSNAELMNIYQELFFSMLVNYIVCTIIILWIIFIGNISFVIMSFLGNQFGMP